MSTFSKLKDQINAAETDAVKFYQKGNKSAGTRLRKALSNIKKIATQARAEVSALKNKESKS